MKLTILCENSAGSVYLAEHGLSYLIEINDEKVLFDTGHSDVFLKNAALMGININEDVKTVVLSHGHWDHGDGLKYLQGQRLICHPLVFLKRYRRMNDTYLGLSQSKKEIQAHFDLQTSIKPVEVVYGLFFLGEIPRRNNFEAQNTMFLDSNKNPDYVPDDSALVAVDGDEIVIITGCSHSGICNIIRHAVKETGIRKVRAVIGGFHLKQKDKQTEKVIECLKDLGVKKVYPSHCTELPALSAFYDAFGIKQLKTGMVIEL